MIKRLETFDLFFAEGLEENDICNKIKSNERFNKNDEHSYIICGDNKCYCQVFRTSKPEHKIKKRRLEFIIEQSYDDDGRDIWKRLLEHEDYDPNCEYVCNRELNDCEEAFDIIYKVV